MHRHRRTVGQGFFDTAQYGTGELAANMASETSNQAEINVVTGAFGYTGKYITHLLLASGVQVKTFTGHS